MPDVMAVRALALGLGRFNAGVEQLAKVIGALGIAFAVSGLAGGALLRFTVGSDSDLLIDLPPRFMPWIVMLLLAPLARRGLHVTVDLLPKLIAPRWLPALRMLVWVVVATASVAFALGSAGAVLFFARMGETAALSVDIPLWWFYLSFPVGFALLAVAALEMLLREVAGLPPFTADRQDDGGAR
jgi:TRAP-type C4-dicarboxylate transport system permease small subunit